MIPITAVKIGREEERLVLEVLRSGQLAQGPMVAQLERAFADLCGVEYAIAVSSGTVALVAALEALDIGPGDEIITSPFTFAGTLNAILARGATARFADIDPVSFCIDPDTVSAQVNMRTRVVIPVHLYGQPADVDSIVATSTAHGIDVVEDAAQAHGATVSGRPVGSFGIGCFSFYATKNVTSGEGGIIVTGDADVAERLRVLRNQGMRSAYAYETVGHNYRLTDLQAAVALPQIARLKHTNARRQANAAALSEGLSGIEGIVTPRLASGREHVFHQYTLRVTSEAPIERDALATRLRARGIGTAVYYPRVVFDYDCYRGHAGVISARVPEAELAARQVLSLPVAPHLSEGDLERIIQAVRDALRT